MNPLRIAILASGTGTTLSSILAATKNDTLSAKVVLVVSNKADAGALKIARNSGVLALHLSQKQFESPEDLDQAFLCAFKEQNVELIALAGYLKKISVNIIRKYKHRMLNIHPALLPSFGGKGLYGIKVHQAVLDYGCKISGVTVHLVDEKYDSGVPVLQRCVPVKKDDTPETLAARVLKLEHQLYVEALQLFAENKIEIQNRHIIIKEKKS